MTIPADRKLLRTLAHELYQTETSAVWHCQREARRLGERPPASALLSVAAHAEAVLAELPSLSERHDLPRSAVGHVVGRLLSMSRQLVLDRVLDSERSYRGTLLGIRHGVDVVRMFSHAAAAAEDALLVTWCRAWLDHRLPLVARVETEMAWFARHPDEALRPGLARLESLRS